MKSEPPVMKIGRTDLLADRVYGELRDSILAGKLRPGDTLSVPELAQHMGVSRSPVREGVQRLIHDGLATHVPYRGAEVSRFEPSRLQGLYVVRELLEGLAARLATERLDPARAADLRKVLAAHERAIRSRSGAAELRHIQLDMKFHRITRQIASNEHLSEFLDMLQGQSHLAYHALWRAPDASRLAYEEHERIFEAMLEGDPAKAEQAARDHIAGLRTRLLETHAGQPDDVSAPGQPSPAGRLRNPAVSHGGLSAERWSGGPSPGDRPTAPEDGKAAARPARSRGAQRDAHRPLTAPHR